MRNEPRREIIETVIGVGVVIGFIAIDYYLQPNIKPKTQFLEEIDRSEKTAIINQLKLNHHKYRFIMVPISFDFDVWQQTEKISFLNTTIIFQYNGVTKAEVITMENSKQLAV